MYCTLKLVRSKIAHATIEICSCKPLCALSHVLPTLVRFHKKPSLQRAPGRRRVTRNARMQG
eukprot:365207-Chlamydomonas_euryale.AAC.3